MAYLDRVFAGGAGRYAPPPMDPDADWADLVASPRAKAERHGEHEVLFHEGDKADRFFEIVDGSVMLYKLLPDGRRQVVEILGPGDLFGLPYGTQQECSAETLMVSTLRAIDRREAESSTGLQRHIAKCLLAQVATLHEHAVLLGRKSAQERVATFLVRLVPRRSRPGCPGPTKEHDEAVIRLSMTRQEIADYLGLTIETVSRVISDLRRRGILAADKQDRLRIPDICALCRLSGMR